MCVYHTFMMSLDCELTRFHPLSQDVIGASDDLLNSRLNWNSVDPELKSTFENWEDTPAPNSSIIVQENDMQVLLISPESSFCNPGGTFRRFGNGALSPVPPDFECNVEGTTLVGALPSPAPEEWEKEDEEYHSCRVQNQNLEEELTPTETRGDSKLHIDTSVVSSLNSFSSIEHGFTLSALFFSPLDSSSSTNFKRATQGPDVPIDLDLVLGSGREDTC